MQIWRNLRSVSRWTNTSGKRAHACAAEAISEVLVGGLTLQESEHKKGNSDGHVAHGHVRVRMRGPMEGDSRSHLDDREALVVEGRRRPPPVTCVVVCALPSVGSREKVRRGGMLTTATQMHSERPRSLQESQFTRVIVRLYRTPPPYAITSGNTVHTRYRTPVQNPAATWRPRWRRSALRQWRRTPQRH